MKKALILLFAAFILIPGCTQHPGISDDDLGDNTTHLQFGQVEISCGIDPWLGFEEEQTPAKSSIDANTLDKIHNINVLVFRYDHDSLVFEPERSRFFEEENPRLLVDIFGKYKVVFLANCGHEILSEVAQLGSYQQICENLRIEYDDYVHGFKETGLPMIYSTDIDAFNTTKIDIRFKRLYSRWALSMDYGALEYSTYEVKSVRIINAPKAIYPMAEASMIKNAADACSEMEGDFLSADDLRRLGNGETVYLYILENMQGELLPDNYNSDAKTPQFLIARGHEDKINNRQLTSIRIEASANTPWAIYNKITYQVFLGKNTYSDFSIERNTPHRLTVKLTADKVVRVDWKIEPDQPVKVFDPRMNLAFETYSDSNGAWRPRITMTPIDCQQLEALYGDFMDKVTLHLTISSKHTVQVSYRNIATWEFYNKLLLQNGGQILGTPEHHGVQTTTNGATLDGYYTGKCLVYPKAYCRSCQYDRQILGKYIFLPAKYDARWTPECFISAIDPGQCEEYTVYNDWYDYDKGYNRYVWSYSPEDYRHANNLVEILLEVELPEVLVDAVKNIYGKELNDFITTSYNLSGGCPYKASDLENLGATNVKFYFKAMPN